MPITPTIDTPVTKFALALVPRMETAAQHKTFVVSPLSLWLALTMAATGAKGETLKELADSLAFEANVGERTGSRVLADVLKFARKTIARYSRDVSIANAIFVGDGVVLTPEFGVAMQKIFSAETFQGVDSERLSQWVSQKTSGRIQRMDVPSTTDLVLLNAVYLKCNWRSKFDKLDTRPHPFHSVRGTRSCWMMTKTEKFSYYDDGNYQVIRMPYVSTSALAAIVILPRRGNPLAIPSYRAMLARLNASVTEVELHLPRFEVKFEAQMKETLKIPTAFSTRANFSAMGHKNGQPLKIEAVIHKTYLKVDESGTEAAAVTAVLMNSYCASEETRRPPVMRVDHPFVFIITDMASGNILFAGGIKEVDVAPAQMRPQTIDRSYGWL